MRLGEDRSRSRDRSFADVAEDEVGEGGSLD